MLAQAKRFDASFAPVVKVAIAATLVAAVIVAALCIAHQLLALTHRYPLDYGEAPLVDQAMRLARGQNIYRADISAPPFTISNYPPLYVATMAPFVALFGPSFFFGRLISIVCAWICAICLGLIVWQVTRDRVAALLSGLSFLAFPFVVRWSSFARIDLLALAFSLAALAVLARRPLANRRMVAGALLLVAAIYTRQSYALAAPLAAFVWVLLQEDVRRAFGLAAIVAGIGGGLFLALNALTGGGFYFNVVTANVNAWSADNLSWNLRQLTDAAPIFLGLAVFSMALGAQRNPLWAMNAPYLVGAFLSFLTVGKVGSNVNYALELCAALSMTAGGVTAWARSRHVVWPGLAAVALIGVQVVHMGRISWEAEWPQLQARRSAYESLQRLEAIVAATDGPVLADEYMGMLTLQGRPLYIQPFEVTQLALEGKWDQKPVLRSIEAKQHPLILIHYFPGAAVYKERWTPQMLDAINRAYRLVGMYADTGVYQPVGQTAAALTVPVEACDGAAWHLPAAAQNGMRWRDGFADFFGRGNAGELPVRAVADGLLIRRDEWTDAVAVQHDDPLAPGRKVWTYYAHMAGPTGNESFVALDFPPGAADVPVKAGDLLGHQGSWSGRPHFPMWVHVRFAVVRALDDGSFPPALTPDVLLDPTPYLGLAAPTTSAEVLQPLRCAAPR
ncbi:MAG: hypothetical protein KatS3mg053_3384 [Candidatus Roseilinea sp.]|nr:MAG: hypothetical protein KatS3mg053_3384 [Candidatus Roseilinea sp.]